MSLTLHLTLSSEEMCAKTACPDLVHLVNFVRTPSCCCCCCCCFQEQLPEVPTTLPEGGLEEQLPEVPTGEPAVAGE